MKLIDKRYTEHPYEGARRLAKWLCTQGHDVGRARTTTLMKKMGIEAIYPKPNTSVPDKAHAIYPYLLRDKLIENPDTVWCADITYIPLQQGWAYLVAIMDWYSRYVIAWEVSDTLEAEFCVKALKRALKLGKCKIFNTDQGSQFTSDVWIELLIENHISISMDGRGRYLDNIFVERLWRSVKYECIYLQEFSTSDEVKIALKKYFKYYNHERLHQALEYATPFDIYSGSQ